MITVFPYRPPIVEFSPIEKPLFVIREDELYVPETGELFNLWSEEARHWAVFRCANEPTRTKYRIYATEPLPDNTSIETYLMTEVFGKLAYLTSVDKNGYICPDAITAESVLHNHHDPKTSLEKQIVAYFRYSTPIRRATETSPVETFKFHEADW